MSEGMHVYFIARVENPDLVKIGTTENVERRLTALAGLHGPIELLALCQGGKSVEAVLHQLFSDEWVEGEWYRRSQLLALAIEKHAGGVSGRRVWGRLRALAPSGASPIEEDRDIARQLLKQMMGYFGAEPFGRLLSKAHGVLWEMSPAWTNRRVRAIWNGEAQRIDHYEVRHMQAAIEFLSAGGGSGGMDLPGIEG